MKHRAILLIVIQCALVSSIALKFAYERATCPRVWVKVAQYDPNLPMRGRYLALSPIVDACSLPRDKESGTTFHPWVNGKELSQTSTNWHWTVVAKAKQGKLVVEDARNILPRGQTQQIWLNDGRSCYQASLSPGIDFFIPDTAKSPFPLKLGQELWAEVTVPAQGPPRPIHLALSDNGQWKPLRYE